MAFMNQERKNKLAANLKAVMPNGWKYSLAVRNYSTIVLTIASAPVDLIGEMNRVLSEDPHRSASREPAEGNAMVNHYYLDKQFDGELLETFKKIDAALNDGNHDRSDIMSDYFDVGWYVDIRIGRWDKPFVFTGAQA